MDVLDRGIRGSLSGNLPRIRYPLGRSAYLRLAIAFSAAAAVSGSAEVLLDRMAAPALGRLSIGAPAVFIAWFGGLAVSITAVFVLLATAVWAAFGWESHPVFAVSASIAVVTTVIAGLVPASDALLVLHISVMAAAASCLAIGVKSASLPYAGALWGVTLFVVAGQWSLMSVGGSSMASRTVAEAALVLALVLLALALFRDSRAKPLSLLGAALGATLAAVSLLSDYTPLVALSATGVMLWLPSLFYVAAGGAAGLVLATGFVHRATRYLSGALVLMVVAGIEPDLVHHNVTALLALIVLCMAPRRQGRRSW